MPPKSYGKSYKQADLNKQIVIEWLQHKAQDSEFLTKHPGDGDTLVLRPCFEEEGCKETSKGTFLSSPLCSTEEQWQQPLTLLPKFNIPSKHQMNSFLGQKWPLLYASESIAFF
jgi:hypothetical protein